MTIEIVKREEIVKCAKQNHTVSWSIYFLAIFAKIGINSRWNEIIMHVELKDSNIRIFNRMIVNNI